MTREYQCTKCGIITTGKADVHGVIRASNGPPDDAQLTPDKAVCATCYDPFGCARRNCNADPCHDHCWGCGKDHEHVDSARCLLCRRDLDNAMEGLGPDNDLDGLWRSENDKPRIKRTNVRGKGRA